MQQHIVNPRLSAIAVVAADGGIGCRGQLLCHLPADLRHFKTLTIGHSLIMGRRTFESLPGGPLKGRQNIVLTRSHTFKHDNVTVAHSISEAIEAANLDGEIFVIGGEQIYRAAMPLVATIYLTRLHATFDHADAFFPNLNDEQWQAIDEEPHSADNNNPFDYTFVTLVRSTPT